MLAAVGEIGDDLVLLIRTAAHRGQNADLGINGGFGFTQEITLAEIIEKIDQNCRGNAQQHCEQCRHFKAGTLDIRSKNCLQQYNPHRALF